MADEILKRLNEQRQKAVAEMREAGDAELSLIAEGKDVPAEITEKYTRANAAIDALAKQMADHRSKVDGDDEWQAAMADAEKRSGAPAGGVPGTERRGGTAGAEWRSQAREALKAGRPIKGEALQAMPDPRMLRTAELRARMVEEAEKRVFLESVSTQGQPAMDETLSANLFRTLFDDSAILSAGVTVLRTSSGENLKFPRLTGRGALSQANARRTEGQTINKGEPTLDQVVLGAYGYKHISQASSEVIQDIVIDVEGLLGQVLGENIANYFGQDLLLGSGTNQPRGVATIVNAGTQKVTTAVTTGAGAGIPTFDELLDVMWKLKPAYRRQGTWLVNDATVLPLRKVKQDTTSNNYLWSPGGPDTPDTIHGRPVVVDPFMATVPTTVTTGLTLIYGAFRQYYVRFVGQTRIDWSTEYAWDTDLVSVRGIIRGDGDAIDDTAFAGLVSSKTA